MSGIMQPDPPKKVWDEGLATARVLVPTRETKTHFYQCVVCGLRTKGAEQADGRVLASNYPVHDPKVVHPSRCLEDCSK